jgi:hypothetical protein
MRTKLQSADVTKRLFRAALVLLAVASAELAPAHAQQALPAAAPNSIPLSFGMNAEQASQALGVALNYVRGRPGDELLVALPNVKGSALASRSDGLYLQFRKGRLSGWKGDWGTIRP